MPLIAMFNSFCQFVTRKVQHLYSLSKWTLILSLVVLSASCSSGEPADAKLDLNVQPAGSPGLYSLTGSTNLPNQSQITVAAIRYLRPEDQQWMSTESKTIYSILDRQVVRVEDGKWQATLNLWQIAPDGRFREVWQLERSSLEASLQPGNEVSFVATFDPNGQLPTAEQQEVKTPELQGSLVRFNNEGDPYVKASQTLRVPLPTGRKPPPTVKPEDINWGWGKRYEIPPQPPVPKKIPVETFKTEQTNAPLSPSEFMR